MKKSMSLFIVLCMVCSMWTAMPIVASAATYGNFTYTTSGTNATITDCATSVSGSVEIPKTIGSYTVTAIGSGAFSGCSGMTSITIPYDVETIATDAFSGCTGLTSITTFGGSRLRALKAATSGCTKLNKLFITDGANQYMATYLKDWTQIKTVELLSSVKEIKFGAFSGCVNVTSVIIPSSVTSIAKQAFYGCTGLKTVSIPGSVKTLADEAFYQCTNLTKVTFNSGITSIGERAFSGCEKLTAITLPNSVTSIGVYAFNGCKSATSLKLPSNLKEIKYDTFNECDSLTSVTINWGTTVIDNYAFARCDNLASVVIPSKVTTIGKFAFGYCPKLNDITIPDSVTGIRGYAFNSTGYSNNSENWDGDLLYVGKHLVESKAGISGSYEVREGTKTISEYAFRERTNLTGVTIPDSVVSIEINAFLDCTGLKSATYLGTNNAWAKVKVGQTGNEPLINVLNIAKVQVTVLDELGNAVAEKAYNKGALFDIALPGYDIYKDAEYTELFDTTTALTEDITLYVKAVESIFTYTTDGTNATITGCDESVSGDIEIPETIDGYTVVAIGEKAFYDCTGITGVTIPYGVTSIGNRAFSGCDNITRVDIPNSVTSIGDWAFANCLFITNVDIPNSVTSIGEMAFYRCFLISVTIPDSVTSIGDGPFTDCNYLESIEVSDDNPNYSSMDGVLFNEDKTKLIQYPAGKDDTSYAVPDSVTLIGNRAFYGCEGLASITIPDGVTSIGSDAFASCNGLTSITIPNSVVSIGHTVFMPCARLESVEIGSGVTSIGNNAFSGCAALTNITYNGTKSSWEEISVGEYDDNFLNVLTFAKVQVTVLDELGEILEEKIYDNGDLFDIELSGYNIYKDAEYTELFDTTTPITEDITLYAKEKSIFTYTTDGEYATITGCDESVSGDIEIPAIIDGYTVTAIGDSAFYDCTGITGVTIPYGVTSIGNRAFSGCFGITHIDIPNSVTTIGSQAFSSCWELIRITIPNSVTTIDSMAFYSCYGLSSITIPASVTTIGEGAFYNCAGLYRIEVSADNQNYSSLDGVLFNKDQTELILYPKCKSGTTYTIPNGVTTISKLAFDNSNLAEIIISNNVIAIGDSAFANCDNLTNVVIPDSVVSIGNSAFSACDWLESIEIGSGVTSIGSYAFSSYRLASIEVVAENQSYSSLDGVLFNKDKTELLQYPESKVGTSYTIPDGVTTIANSALKGCDKLTNITIPNSVTSIADWAFLWCDKLSNATYLGTKSEWENVTVGKENADLTDVITIAKVQVTVLDEFGGVLVEKVYDNGDLFDIGVTGYDIYKDSGYTELFDTTMPLTEDITLYAKEIESIFTYTTDGINATITGCDKSVCDEIEIPGTINGYTVTAIGAYAFSGCENITGIIIPDSVTSIGEGAFYECSGLMHINIPDGVTHIENSTFTGCKTLEFVDIPAGVTSIGDGAFAGCSYIMDITIPGNVTYIGNYAFSSCGNLQCVNITDNPNGIITVGDNVFEGSGLTSIYIPLGMIEIGEYMFKDCRNLENVIIFGADTIRKGAFEGCHNLTEVLYVGNSGAWQDYVNVESGNEALYGVLKFTIIQVTILDETGEVLREEAYGSGELFDISTLEKEGYQCEIYTDAECTELFDETQPLTVDIALYVKYIKNIFTYRTEDENAIITVCDPSASGDIEIPRMIDGYTVTGIDTYAFAECENITSIYIPDTVTTIEVDAFASDLLHCAGLTRIEVDENNPNYSSLDGVLFNKNQTELIQYPMGNANTTYTIPDGVETLGHSAFIWSENLLDIHIPDSVTSISSTTFAFCSGLESITIPDGVETVAGFYGCESLEVINIGSGTSQIIIDIQPNMTSSLQSINVDEENEYYSSVDGVLFDEEKTKLLVYPWARMGSYTIPDGVVEFGCAFGYSLVTEIIIPDSVTVIDSDAFFCAPLEKISIPDSVTTIGDRAFVGTYLESITIPNSVTSIGEMAFEAMLTSATYLGTKSEWENVSVGELNDALLEVLSFAKVQVTVRDEAGEILEEKTYNNGDLFDIKLPEEAWFWYEIYTDAEYTGLFDTTQPLTEDITLYAKFVNNMFTYTVDGENATITGCHEAVSGDVEIPETIGGYRVTGIGESAFADNEGVTSIIVPDSVTTIGTLAFSGCDKLVRVEIGSGVEYIGNNVFLSYNLDEIVVDEENEYYSSLEGVLFDKDKTTLIKYPVGKTDESYEIPDTVTTVGNGAFLLCRNITDIIIPSSVTSIDICAFKGFDKLTSVTYLGTKVEWKNVSVGETNEELLDVLNFAMVQVTVVDESGEVLSEKAQNNGELFTIELSAPTGYKYEIYTDSAYAELFNIEQPLTDDITLYAKLVATWENMAQITGATYANVGDSNVAYSVTLGAREDDVGYVTVNVKYPKELTLRNAVAKDFAELEIVNTETSGDYTTTDILCIYSYDGEVLPVETPIKAFDIYFDVSQTIDLGEIEIELTEKSILMGAKDYPFEALVGAVTTIMPKLPESVAIVSGADSIDAPEQYVAEILPDYTTDKSVIWSVDDESIATISQDGVLTPLKNGTVTITVTSVADANVKATKTVNVCVYAKINSITTDGFWAEDFVPNVREYTIYVDEDMEDFNISATYSLGTLKVNGSTLISGRTKTVSIPDDETQITVERANASGFANVTYTLNVVKNSNPLICDVEDGAYKILFNRNKIDMSEGGRLIVAMYDENNALAGLADAEVSDEDKEKIVEVDPWGTAVSAKVMLVKGFSDFVPLCTASEVAPN